MAEDFQQIIDQDRETRKKTFWRGTLLEYLELVKEDPSIAKLSHSRLFDMMISKGADEINTDEDPRLARIFKGKKLKVYGFFADEFRGALELRGLKDGVTYRVTDYLHGRHFPDVTADGDRATMDAEFESYLLLKVTRVD